MTFFPYPSISYKRATLVVRQNATAEIDCRSVADLDAPRAGLVQLY
jgi:hypothetical protein